MTDQELIVRHAKRAIVLAEHIDRDHSTPRGAHSAFGSSRPSDVVAQPTVVSRIWIAPIKMRRPRLAQGCFHSALVAVRAKDAVAVREPDQEATAAE